MIHGMTVILLDRKQIGTDPFGNPTYEYVEIPVDDVLVSPASTDDQTTSINLHGKHIVYTLAIPKGDAHEWEDREIRFWGRRWRSFGAITQGIETNLPLRWNKKVQVEAYE